MDEPSTITIIVWTLAPAKQQKIDGLITEQGNLLVRLQSNFVDRLTIHLNSNQISKALIRTSSDGMKVVGPFEIEDPKSKLTKHMFRIG